MNAKRKHWESQGLPSVSIAIPTFNSERVLGECLASIKAQDYPSELVEIIIADAGSTDSTASLAWRYADKVVANKLVTGEAGKAQAAKVSEHDLIAFIDSDNILPHADWLRRMVEPFRDPVIIASEPISYTYRQHDSCITRYCALMGMNDPLCYFLGNYDRVNLLTGSWTGLRLRERETPGYIEVLLERGPLPTIGANGFVIRREVLFEAGFGDYLFDIDIVARLAEQRPLLLAKVKTSITHAFCDNMAAFSKKQNRRVRDYLYYKHAGVRRYDWPGVNRKGLVKFILATVTIAPLFWQSLRGYARFRDRAWFFHIPACLATLGIYGTAAISQYFGRVQLERDNWSQ